MRLIGIVAGGKAQPITDVTLVTTEGFVYNPDNTNTYTDTGGTTLVTTDGDLVARTDDLTSFVNNATQGTSTNRPQWRDPYGVTADGTNDWMFTNYNAASSAGTLAARCRVDTTSTGTEVVLGNAQGTNRHWISFTTGVLSMGIGNLGSDSFKDAGAVDRRSASTFVNIAGVFNSGSAELFVNGSSVATASYGGTVDTTRTVYMAARNATGSADSFFTGDIMFALAQQRAMSSTEIQDLHDYWDSISS